MPSAFDLYLEELHEQELLNEEGEPLTDEELADMAADMVESKLDELADQRMEEERELKWES